ncbi:hypothetical protein ZWY2020_054128 [Hordeum vulgare]|nr:hypothetical protein ZWY2020_054128 [Hordeum vulgare]
MKAPNLHGQLQVTFCAVAPPLVSYFCVHATHMDHTEFAVEPFINATETDSGLVLVCIVPALHLPLCYQDLEQEAGGGTFISRRPLHNQDIHHWRTPRGTVAWVDLWHNIVFCDVLARHPKLTCLDLPPPIRPGPDVGVGDPMSLRNIAVLGNTIKYVEMLPHPDRSSSNPPSYRWEVAAWSIHKARRSWPKDWHAECKLDSTHLKVDDGSGTIAATFPTLSTLHVGLPTFSLQNDAIFYFLAKVDYRQSEHTAWVLVVDMQTKTVTQAVQFCAERTLGLA